MSFQDLLKTDQFLLIAELEPPKGSDTSLLLKQAERLKGRVHSIFLPEMKGAIMRMGSLGASFYLRQKGIEVITEINCRDRNRLALQSDILSASALGINNLFISTGDDITSGDHIEAKPVNDLEAISLLEAVKKLKQGTDLMGNDLLGTPQFCVGAEVNGGLVRDALEQEIEGMEKKIEAGAEYFVTPTNYDMKSFENFMKKAAHLKIPVFPQLIILKSVGMARFMSRHMEGITIPEEVIDRLSKAPDKIKEGIGIAADTIQSLKGLCPGVLLVSIGDEERLPAVLDLAGF